VIRTWDDGTISDTEDVPISEDAIPLRKSADSEGHSNKASEDTQTTKSTDIGEDGNPYYHQLESSTQEKRQEEQAFRKQLNKSIRNMVSGTNHQGIRLIVHRPEITPEFIEEYKIGFGNFDNVTECVYNIPDYWTIGEVYERLIEDVSAEDNVLDILIEVYTSWMDAFLSNYNIAVYYQSREYICQCYKKGEIL